MLKPKVKKTLGERLREERKALDLTVERVCERLGMSTSNYIRIESGRSVPLRKDTLKELSRVFAIPYDALVNYALANRYAILMEGESGDVVREDRDDYSGTDLDS